MSRLSIAIPVFNFAEYLPETLRSLQRQDRISEVEIVVFDGASTDNTSDVIAHFQPQLAGLRGIFAPARGGIDRDMASAVSATSGDFVWLFSGDDIMAPGSIAWALDAIAETNVDLFLCRHFEWSKLDQKWSDYPILRLAENKTFDLAYASQRVEYASHAITSEAFFSFIGGLLVRRTAWQELPFPTDFDGTCWAHAARLARVIAKRGLRIEYVATPKLYRRPDNDSFQGSGLIERFRLGIEGYSRIAREIFLTGSPEAKAIGDILRHDFDIWHLLTGKYVAHLSPTTEDATLNARLVRMVYPRWTFRDLMARLKYARTSPQDFAKRNEARSLELRDLYGQSLHGHTGAKSAVRIAGDGAIAAISNV